MSDLVERLRDEDSRWQRECDGWMSRIKASDPDVDHSSTEATLRKTIWAESAIEIERLQREKLAWLEASVAQQKRAQKAEAALADARRYAFFVGWEMCETAGTEDTCADAWAFWRLMEDGRDEAEGRGIRAKAEETQG